MKEQKQNHVVDFLFTLALFCVFAASALLVVLMGAKSYKTVVSTMDRNYESRTCSFYLTQKLRQCDTQGAVRLGQLGDGPGEWNALVLCETYNGAQYETWIYTYQGMLREVLIKAGREVKATDGQMILELQGMSLEQDGGLIDVTLLGTDGTETSFCLFPRCGQGQSSSGMETAETEGSA